MIQELLSEFVKYMNSGGFVMWPLFVANLFLWYGLGYRFLILLGAKKKKDIRSVIDTHEKKGDKKKIKGILDMAVADSLEVYYNLQNTHSMKYLRQNLEDTLFVYRQETARYSILVKTIVVIAPLTGLLGTVIGMIETFDSLTTMSLFTQGGGIAGGISQALFTTQLGLVVSIPGLIVGRILDKREQNFNFELDQIKDVLSTKEEG